MADGVMKSQWAGIDSCERAVKAAKSAWYLALYVVVFYALAAYQYYFVYGGTVNIEGIEPNMPDLINAINILIMIVFAWMGWRIRKGNLGTVPIVALWIFVEIILRTLVWLGTGHTSATAIFISSATGATAINALNGWYKQRKY